MEKLCKTISSKTEPNKFALGIVLSSFFFICLIDAVTTMIGIKYFIAHEANPFILNLSSNLSFEAVALIKVLVGLSTVTVFYFCRNFKILRFTIYLLTCIYGLFIIYQTYTIFGR